MNLSRNDSVKERARPRLGEASGAARAGRCQPAPAPDGVCRV